MRKTFLCLTVVFLTSCSWFNRDLWSAYTSLPLEVETLETFDFNKIDHFRPIDGATYLVNRENGEESYSQWCNSHDDSVISTFPTSLLVKDAILADGALFAVSSTFSSYPITNGTYTISRINTETMEVETAITFDLDTPLYRQAMLFSGNSSIFLVLHYSEVMIKEYSYDLEWISDETFAFTEDEPRMFSWLTDLSFQKVSFVDETDVYFALDQTLFHKAGSTVTQLPYSHVLSFEKIEDKKFSFLQYDYESRAGKEYFNLDRISIDNGDLEQNRETIFSIEKRYLSSSHEKNNAFLFAFAFFEGDLYFIGARKSPGLLNQALEFGILRLELDSLNATAFFQSGEQSYEDAYFYYNGHFVYTWFNLDESMVRQINFKTLLP